MKFEREKAKIEEELIWQPSGLRVHLEAYTSPTTARVRTNTGATFNVAMENLEHVDKPAVGVTHTKDILAFVLRQAGLDAMADKAADGYYHDFLSPLPAPCMQLATDLKAEGTPAALAILDRHLNGDFDATKEESDAWAASGEGKAAIEGLIRKEKFGAGDGP